MVFKEPSAKKIFSYSTLFPICNLILSTSFMSLNAFLLNIIILITTKNYMNFIFHFFFLTILANFHTLLKIIPLKCNKGFGYDSP